MECHSGAPLHATTLTKMRIRDKGLWHPDNDAVTHHL